MDSEEASEPLATSNSESSFVFNSQRGGQIDESAAEIYKLPYEFKCFYWPILFQVTLWSLQFWAAALILLFGGNTNVHKIDNKFLNLIL